MVICSCKEWKDNWPQIEAAQLLAYYHNVKYTGTIFRFCPWCGVPLIEKESARAATCRGS